MPETIGQILDRHRGHGPGFDALRVYLSVSVLAWHSFAVCGGDVLGVWTAPYGRWFVAMVPIFFCLSGFLVMGSAVRVKSLRHFLANRFLRIFPALVTEITLSALVLGPLVTILPLKDYFSSPVLYVYFGSLVGNVQFFLPGVFLNNPLPGLVNGNLWTIPPEILCYLWMAAMITTALSSERIPVTFCAAAVLALNLAQDSIEHFGHQPGNFSGRYLVECFAFGTAFYMWRDVLPYRWPLFTLAAIVGLTFLPTPGWQHVSIFAITYCTAFLGSTPLPKGKIFGSGDYSYGIYLFGGPIEQAVASVFPSTRYVWIHLPICLVLTVGVAALSWNLVEKRALSLRKHISSSDSILRRHYLARFFALAAIIGYAVTLVRISGIALTGELSSAKVTFVAVVIGALALCGAALPAVRSLLFRQSGGVLSK